MDHLWGNGGNCGNDNVNDTPTQEEENYNCPAFPHNANSCGTSNSSGDMFMNYMDYTNDGCMNLFTQGQKARMISAINLYRSDLLSHNLCNNITSFNELPTNSRKLIKVIDILGRENSSNSQAIYLYIYDDNTVEKKIIIK